VAGLAAAEPSIAARGVALVVVGPAKPEHLAGFREVTGYTGPLYADPSLATFSAAGLAYGWGRTFHPLSILRGVRAFATGFRQGARRGNPVQQGGLFVLGPGERVRYEWRDRFAGDHAPMSDVVAALA
jgi:alkyl-hydroperoxide reductase/thiol specific antioxidant family protein